MKYFKSKLNCAALIQQTGAGICAGDLPKNVTNAEPEHMSDQTFSSKLHLCPTCTCAIGICLIKIDLQEMCPLNDRWWCTRSLCHVWGAMMPVLSVVRLAGNMTGLECMRWDRFPVDMWIVCDINAWQDLSPSIWCSAKYFEDGLRISGYNFQQDHYFACDMLFSWGICGPENMRLQQRDMRRVSIHYQTAEVAKNQRGGQNCPKFLLLCSWTF